MRERVYTIITDGCTGATPEAIAGTSQTTDQGQTRMHVLRRGGGEESHRQAYVFIECCLIHNLLRAIEALFSPMWHPRGR